MIMGRKARLQFLGLVVSMALAGCVGDRAGFSGGNLSQGISDGTLGEDLDKIAQTGAKWVRVGPGWDAAQPNGPSDTPSFSATDQIVQGAMSRGLNVLVLLDHAPGWDTPGCTNGSDAHCGYSYCPPDVADATHQGYYTSFVKQIVKHYKPMGVHYYEIWNEPNNTCFWKSPNAADYTTLLRLAYTAIKTPAGPGDTTYDPSAVVLSGGTAPEPDDGVNIAQLTFLRLMYQHGARGYFDAVATHPYSGVYMPAGVAAYPDTYGGTSPPPDWATMGATYNQFYRLPMMHDLMLTNGDGHRKIWGTEFGQPTCAPPALIPQCVSAADQADIAKRGYEAWVRWPWAGVLMWNFIRDAYPTAGGPAEQHYGLLDTFFNAKPAYASYQQTMREADSLGAGGGGYVLDGFAGVHTFGEAGGPTPPGITGGIPYNSGYSVRGIAVAPQGDGGYMVDGYGNLYPFAVNSADPTVGPPDGPVNSQKPPPATGNATWLNPPWDIARGVALLPDGSGGYVVDGWGGIHPFSTGNAPAPPTPAGGPYWSGWDIARGIAVLGDATGGYVLDGWGGLHPFALGGHAPPPAAVGGSYWSGGDIARGVTLLPNGSGGYVLDGWGGIHTFSVGGNNPTPPAPTGGPYWYGWDIGRGITIR